MLTLDNVEIRQGTYRLEADFSVTGPGLFAVIGPSGAGKSTLLAAIAGFIVPTAGRVFWDQRDLTDLPPGDRPLSVVFQDNNLFPHLDAQRNVALGLGSGRLSEAENQRIDEALARVGLVGKERRKPAALSGGEQGRVALARALVRDAPLVLLDEPFSALGPALKAEMLDLVDAVLVKAGKTVLFVTHDPEDARRMAPQTILVAEGMAHAPQPTQALLDDAPAALRDYLE
ncbi:MAG: ATP-binding cassette domain-containing protein [Rhodobacteraceae bacterium]|nr:ATP-binding cassette domain-containing protein [Paracoccaceae bacterium]